MPFHSSPELIEFVKRIPKTENHLHLEGALPYELLQHMNKEKYRDLPASYGNDYTFKDFDDFERQLLELAFAWYISPERYHYAATKVFKQHLELGVRYVETSFASGVIQFLGLNGKEVLAAIKDAIPKELTVKVFLGVHHDGFQGDMQKVFEEALTWEQLDGLDLHGSENIPVDPIAPKLWEEARNAGKYTKAHAGEFCGADFVRYVIDVLGVKRIQHGIRAVEDPALVQLIKQNNISLDVCPISNIKLVPGVTKENHPIKELFDQGVSVTVSTDDPLVFGNSIIEEYTVLHDYRGFSQSELIQVAKNGFNCALLEDEEKLTYIDELDRALELPKNLA